MEQDIEAEMRGLGAIRALSRVPQDRMFKLLRGWSVPGSNRRPPACKFSCGVVSVGQWRSEPRKQAVGSAWRRRGWPLSVVMI